MHWTNHEVFDLLNFDCLTCSVSPQMTNVIHTAWADVPNVSAYEIVKHADCDNLLQLLSYRHTQFQLDNDTHLDLLLEVNGLCFDWKVVSLKSYLGGPVFSIYHLFRDFANTTTIQFKPDLSIKINVIWILFIHTWEPRSLVSWHLSEILCYILNYTAILNSPSPSYFLANHHSSVLLLPDYRLRNTCPQSDPVLVRAIGLCLTELFWSCGLISLLMLRLRCQKVHRCFLTWPVQFVYLNYFCHFLYPAHCSLPLGKKNTFVSRLLINLAFNNIVHVKLLRNSRLWARATSFVAGTLGGCAFSLLLYSLYSPSVKFVDDAVEDIKFSHVPLQKYSVHASTSFEIYVEMSSSR